MTISLDCITGIILLISSALFVVSWMFFLSIYNILKNKIWLLLSITTLFFGIFTFVSFIDAFKAVKIFYLFLSALAAVCIVMWSLSCIKISRMFA